MRELLQVSYGDFEVDCGQRTMTLFSNYDKTMGFNTWVIKFDTFQSLNFFGARRNEKVALVSENSARGKC